MTSRYTGTFFILKSLAVHYFILSNPFSYMTLISGIMCVLMAGISAAFLRTSRRFFYPIRLFVIMPFLIGMIGTGLLINSSRSAAWLEKENGIISSSAKYYDWQYGLCKPLLYFFPAGIGVIGSFSALLFVRLIRRRMGTI